MGGTRTSPSHPGGNSLPSQNVAAELLIGSSMGVGSRMVDAEPLSLVERALASSPRSAETLSRSTPRSLKMKV